MNDSTPVPLGLHIAPSSASSILPQYAAVGTSVLPRYAPIGSNVVNIPEVQIVGDPHAEAAKQAAIRAGLLFFIGLTLGFIWGGTTGGISRAS